MGFYLRKYRYPIMIFLLLLFNVCIVLKNRDSYILNEHVVKTNLHEKKIELRDDNKYRIRVYYPISDYRILDKEIESKIEKTVFSFQKEIESLSNLENQYYSLDIYYDTYAYQDYLSYAFYISEDTGGAHPSSDIWTIVFNAKEKRIVDLDFLLEKYPDILSIFSKYSRDTLKDNPRITNLSMLMEGTKPIPENYSTFVFSDKGIILFFPPYSIASYSSGTFQVVVPYSKVF